MGKSLVSCFFSETQCIYWDGRLLSCKFLLFNIPEPEEVVSADHLSLFIRRLKRVKLNQFLIGKI